MKSAILVLLLFIATAFLLSGCYEYGPPPAGSVGPAPGHYHSREMQDPPPDSPPPSGEVGPAPTREYAPSDYTPPVPSGAVGPARYR